MVSALRHLRRRASLGSGLAALALVGFVLPSRGAGGEPSPLTPVDLLCDSMVNPLGVDSTPPRLSWQLRGDGQRGLRQGAWRRPRSPARDALERGQGALLDTGAVGV